MNGVGILSAIVIGIFAGWLAEQIMGRRDGLVTNLIVGLVGALLGSFIAGSLGVGFAGFFPSLLISTLGAVVLLLIVNMIRGRRAV